jgi:hypothetical protein
MKEVVESLKDQQRKVEKEIDEQKLFSIKTEIGKGKSISIPKCCDKTSLKITSVSPTTEEKILGHIVSKKSPHTMMGNKLNKNL